MGSEPARALVVELHDVAPSRATRVREMLAELDRLGLRQRVLEVIPAEPGSDASDYASLLDLLRSEQEQGSEIVLHGWTHRVARPVHGLRPRALRTRLVAPADAEFMSLDREEAASRIVAGRDLLAASGLRAGGFCAPCWLAQPWLPELLAGLGFSHYVGMSELRDLRRGRRQWLPWAGQIGAGALHEAAIGAISAALLAAGAGSPCVKVFLHPTGSLQAPPLQRTLGMIRSLLRTRVPATYAQLLA